MIRHGLIVLFLTIVTQLGGLAWLLALVVRRFTRRLLLPFLALYIGLSVAASVAAPITGRVALPCVDAGPDRIAVLHPIYCALNRHYVRPEMAAYGDALAAHMDQQFPGTRTRALDGNFPFLDGFPLLPHLSHDDGEKLDLALFYTDQAGVYQPGRARWFLGYWAYEQPRPGDLQPCADVAGLSLRWDMAWLQPLLRDWPLDEPRTGEMLRWLAANPQGRDFRVLVEPHLQARLDATGTAIRFQGCRAARHDDHLHLQFRP